MSFYIAIDELNRENIIARRTALKAIADSRLWLAEIGNGFYDDYTDKELLELAENGQVEIELVKIPEEFPADCSREHLERIYNHYGSGIVPRPPR